MTDKSESYFELDNLRSVEIEDKVYLYYSIRNIDSTFPVNLDKSLNTITFEIAQLLINFVKLIEMRYFDVTFYLLRQANELSWVYFLFADLDSVNLKISLK